MVVSTILSDRICCRISLGACADCPADTNFGGTFFHGYHHNIRYADGTCQQSPQSYHPNQYVDTGKQIVYHRKHCFRIQVHKCLFVVRRDIMRSFNNLFHFRLYVGHFDSMLHGEQMTSIRPPKLYVCCIVVKGRVTASEARPCMFISPSEEDMPIT